MDKRFLIAGTTFGLLAVIIGAFGAHALKEILTKNELYTFETGVKYQMYHALLLVVLSVFAKRLKPMTTVLWLLVIGTLFFSGSIYGLATNELTGFDFTIIALITPLGGTLLIASWGILLYKAITLKTK